MYIALFILFLGLPLGLLLRKRINRPFLDRIIFMAILLLLFLLGAQIGANERLFADLPNLGGQALILMLFCVAGSIVVIRFFVWLLAKRGLRLNGSKNAR